MYQITSSVAYKSIYDFLGASQRLVLDAIYELKECNNQEIARHLNWEINRVTPRVHELRDKGYVEEIRKSRDKITGRLCIFWGIKTNQTTEHKIDECKIREL